MASAVVAGCFGGTQTTAPITQTPARSSGEPSDEEARDRSRGGMDGRAAQAANSGRSGTPGEPVAKEPLPLPADTKVLHVGDSFAGALGLPLAKLLKEKGLRSVLKFTDASYLTTWAWEDDLQTYMWKYNPDLVIVTLGANELGIADPERRSKTIEKIIDTIGDRPCVWVAIPLWDAKHNGLMDVVEDNVGPCVFFDTNELLDVENMPRISDGVHPTTQAREDWARFFLDWLRKHRDPAPDRPWQLKD